jgi:acetyl-CoA C-acetyltransferase
MQDVYLVSVARTPIGAFQGSLSSFSATKLGALAIKEAVARSGVQHDKIDEVLMGCVLTTGLGQAPARQAALGAGLSNSIPCTTINKVCGSGMKSIMLGAQAIRSGDAQIVVCGGMESMSNAPYALDKARQGYRLGHGQLLDTMIADGLWDPYKNVHMGNCADATVEKFHFTREELDQFSAMSYQRALDAQKSGHFNNEMVAVQIPQRKGEPLVFDQDEAPSKGNPGKLAQLKPAFSPTGAVTAGNASSLSDGAAAVVLASGQAVESMNLKPIAKVVSSVQHAQEPEWFTTAPAFAIEKLLKKNGLTVNDIDVFEINEAFAVVAMIVAKQLSIAANKMNLNGGAVALGHPIGMTGTRLVITAAIQLQRQQGKYAVATPCIGGGEATAVLLERV